TSKGRFHACPFAVEIDAPHYNLGSAGTDPEVVFRNYRAFREWIDAVLDPAARARGVSSCEMCHRHLAELPAPEVRGVGARGLGGLGACGLAGLVMPSCPHALTPYAQPFSKLFTACRISLMVIVPL